MGKQKGKLFFRKAFGGTTGAKAPKQNAAKAGKKPAPEFEQAPPPVGLPAGWIAEKRTGQSGKKKGKTYLRFRSADGKHTDISTIPQAIRKDAADKGYSPEPVLQELEKKKGEAEARREQDCKAKNETMQKAVDAFVAKHGHIDRPTIAHLPGWTVETRVVESTGQKVAQYSGPDGVSLCMLKQVEALFGAQVLAGKEVVGLEEARKLAAQAAPTRAPGKRKRSKRKPRAMTKDKMHVDKKGKPTKETGPKPVKKKIKKTRSK